MSPPCRRLLFQALGAATLATQVVFLGLRSVLPDFAQATTPGSNSEEPPPKAVMAHVAQSDIGSLIGRASPSVAEAAATDPAPPDSHRVMYSDVGNLNSHASPRIPEAAAHDLAPAAPSSAQGSDGYLLALHQDEVPCHRNIAPWPFYRPDGTAYGGDAISRGIWRVVDSNGGRWTLKVIADGHEAWKWIEVTVMLLRLPFNFFLRSVFSTATLNFLVMPELPFGTLWKVIHARGPWSSARRLRPLSAQLAFGIWELNQRGMYHGDVKPPNIMLLDDNGDNITLIDYDTVTYNCKRKRGRPCDYSIEAGTPSHMALSLWTEGHGFSYEVDWWAFGVVVHTMMYGSYPFGEGGVKDSEQKVWTDKSDLWREDPALARLLDLTIGASYLARLETPEGRQALESHLPEEHPVLSLDYWLGDNMPSDPAARTQALRDFWRGVCVNHTLHPSKQCAEMFYPKQTTKVYPEKCPQVDKVECCCKRAKCMDQDSHVGIDMEHAVESTLASSEVVCCLRRRACGFGFPIRNGTLPGAVCHESWMHEDTWPNEIDNSDEDPGPAQAHPSERPQGLAPSAEDVDGQDSDGGEKSYRA